MQELKCNTKLYEKIPLLMLKLSSNARSERTNTPHSLDINLERTQCKCLYLLPIYVVSSRWRQNA